MAASASSSSSSSSVNAICPRPNKYDVFLSFRGTDTRNGFLGHLYKALTGKGIRTYIDENSLERGSEIGYSLAEAVQESEASVVVLSENYGGSWWCLDELVQIIQCRERKGLVVVPVFYRVEPTHVRKQLGKFGEAFSELKERFKGCEEKLTSWSTALSRVSDLSGHGLSVTSSESETIANIVDVVKKKLNKKSRMSNAKGLVGIVERVKEIKSLLRIGDQNTLAVGIWGMGGIGKTTLAKAVFDELRFEFEGCCFLKNVREDWENDKEQLKCKLYSKLLNEENPYNPEERVSNKKVFVVLDDVNEQEQLEFLLGDGLGDGSRVIATTRDKQSLDVDFALYEVEELDRPEALELFLMSAFRNESHLDLDTKLLNRVMSYAQGVPLAIQVLGSHLHCKRKENWEREMDKMERSPNDKIQNVLKVSYNGLDGINKKIFLDVACFFKGQRRDSVEAILDGCGFYAKTGIDDLIDKSLLTVSDNQLWMHDLVQEMGRGIVNSTAKREERSRLWNDEDIVHVLENNIGSNAIEGIFLDPTKIGVLELSPVVFERMCDLRYLIIDDCEKQKLCFPRGLAAIPHELRYINWCNFPLESLPSNFKPHNLVELNMSNSQLGKLWDGVQALANLKRINLRNSKKLKSIPDLSRAPKLRSVLLYHCTSLVQIPPLGFRNREHCALELSNLSTNIVFLDLSRTTIEHVPLSVEHLSSTLERLSLGDCKKLKSLPTNLYKLKALVDLVLDGCSSLREFPQKLPPALQYLNASRCTSLEQVSDSETLTRAHWSDYDYKTSKMFLFFESLKLNQNARRNILIEYQIRILRSATMPSFYRHDSDGITFCVPGNKIPDWFNCQSDEPNITINLPENWQSIEFIGFALCVCATFEESNFNINCEYYYRNNNCRSDKIFRRVFSSVRKPRNCEVHHLFMWYMDKDKHGSCGCCDALSITFEFEFDLSESAIEFLDSDVEFSEDDKEYVAGDIIKVNKCGVRLLTLNDANEYGYLNRKC